MQLHLLSPERLMEPGQRQALTQWTDRCSRDDRCRGAAAGAAKSKGGWKLINDEADMKVGFDQPFEPRMTERFPAWLAATLIMHEALNEKYAQQGLRFIAASDNANQQLIRSRFDGRRSIMTMASGAPDDLLKLPVYAFYELLPFLTCQ
jgi:hypothetical protein